MGAGTALVLYCIDAGVVRAPVLHPPAYRMRAGVVRVLSFGGPCWRASRYVREFCIRLSFVVCALTLYFALVLDALGCIACARGLYA